MPPNLPGLRLDPQRSLFDLDQNDPFDIRDFYLLGADGHRVDLAESAMRPSGTKRTVLRFAELQSALRPGVEYQLQQVSLNSGCSARQGLPQRGFITGTSSAALPTAAPALTVDAPSMTRVYLYGSAMCAEAFDRPAVELRYELPPQWAAWRDAVDEVVLVDGQPYSNWSIEAEGGVQGTRVLDRVVFARCGAQGSGGGVGAGQHTAQIELTLPGHGRFLSNRVQFTLDCRLNATPDAGVADASTPGGSDSGAAGAGGGANGAGAGSSGCSAASGREALARSSHWPPVLMLVVAFALILRRRVQAPRTAG